MGIHVYMAMLKWRPDLALPSLPPAECRLGVRPRADASVVLPSVPRPALSAALPLSVPQRDEGLPGESGRPGHGVEQFRWCVRLLVKKKNNTNL